MQPAKSPSATFTKDERGFTLVEVIVAIMVCTVGLMGMAQLLAVTLRMQQLGRNSTSAVRLATDKIDELGTLNFATAAPIQCGGSLTTSLANYSDTPAGYLRRWRVQAGPDGDLKLRQVTVRLIPTRADGRITAPYEMVTIVRGVSSPC